MTCVPPRPDHIIKGTHVRLGLSPLICLKSSTVQYTGPERGSHFGKRDSGNQFCTNPVGTCPSLPPAGKVGNKAREYVISRVVVPTVDWLPPAAVDCRIFRGVGPPGPIQSSSGLGTLFSWRLQTMPTEPRRFKFRLSSINGEPNPFLQMTPTFLIPSLR